ncbi:MAG: DUF433 domain-containing protein [Leptolyngbya sp. RL_3_1]|nr:DUF433 domain-containing protein [Leptolyngbya sp. RL_3_1]
MTFQEILEDYPNLEVDDIRACLVFAAKLLSVKSILQVNAA